MKKGLKKGLLILAIIGVCMMLMSGPALGAYTKGMKSSLFWILGYVGDHTYHCADSGCWSWTGGESGGSYIAYSGGYGNYTKAKCTSTNWGCRFVYAVNGVCHQETNRGLYTSGKTIARGGVKGYWFTGPYFGTYGSWSTWVACKTACWLW